MDEATNARVMRFKEEALAMLSEVTAALDGDEENRHIEVNERVEAFTGRYKALLSELSPNDRAEAEQTLERRVIDLRREAASLTRRVPGSKAERAIDAGSVPFLERRAPPRSIEPQRSAPARHGPKFRVGGEVEAWCGKCREICEHHVVAMVGDQPKQVICAKCNSRHNYRAEPTARAAATSSATSSMDAARAAPMRTPVDPEVARKAEAKRALERELAEATNLRSYDPRERYRPNDIVVHPEHGRGKVENVLRGSMLVRFRDGLRPLNLK